MDRETQRAQLAAELRAAAERRFGAVRAEALAKPIEDAAGWLTEVAAFAVAADEPPAFYAEPAP